MTIPDDLRDDDKAREGSPLSSEQRKALADLCQLHERGLGGDWLGRTTLRLVVRATILTGIAAILLNLMAYSPLAYVFPAFLLGVLLRDLVHLLAVRRVWPLYEAVIDWGRAARLLEAQGPPGGPAGPG